jgi:hypothetical protein
MDELVPSGVLRTKGKPGQTPIEVMTLGGFRKLAPVDMVLREIRKVHYTSYCLILIDGDKNYIKLVPVEERDLGSVFESEDLTMQDLRNLGYFSDEDWQRYLYEAEKARNESQRRSGRTSLARALNILGAKEVAKIAQENIKTES